MLMDQGAVEDIVSDYWVTGAPTEDYFEVIDIGWNGLPLIFFLVIVFITLIVTATAKRRYM